MDRRLHRFCRSTKVYVNETFRNMSSTKVNFRKMQILRILAEPQKFLSAKFSTFEVVILNKQVHLS